MGSHADTPTEVSVSTQTVDLMRSIVYDDSSTTDRGRSYTTRTDNVSSI